MTTLVALAAILLALAALPPSAALSTAWAEAPTPAKVVTLSDAQRTQLRTAQVAKLKPLTGIKLDVKATLAKVPEKNVFRILIAQKSAKKAPKLSAADQKLVAELNADMDKVWRITSAAHRGQQPSAADQKLIEKIKAKYQPQRDEVYQALLNDPKMTPDAKKALTESVGAHPWLELKVAKVEAKAAPKVAPKVVVQPKLVQPVAKPKK